MWPALRVRNDQKSGSFEQKNLISIDNVGEGGQAAFKFLHVRN